MIFITDDCHGNFERFNASIFPEQNEMAKDDYVIAEVMGVQQEITTT